MTGEFGVALIGAGQISCKYVEAWDRVPGARVVAVASRSQESASRLADRCGASRAVSFEALPALLSEQTIDLVCVNSTNHLHARHAIAAARAGKHVIVEKPFCLTLDDATAMMEASRAAGKGLAYAENLCFAPQYRRARELVAAGAVGPVLYARQCEKHGGPYSSWFWRAQLAGGGALMDMGCHGIECLRWLLGKPCVARVSARLATLCHGDRTELEDDAVVTLELADGRQMVSESSWALRSGMQSTLEVRGTDGVLELDLLGGKGLRIRGQGEDLGRPGRDRLEDDGYPMQLAHFLDCFRRGIRPQESGEDGYAVLEILLAAYASARRGEPVELPFDAPKVARPVDLWRL
jgi:predicted dehydrogenase